MKNENPTRNEEIEKYFEQAPIDEKRKLKFAQIDLDELRRLVMDITGEDKRRFATDFLNAFLSNGIKIKNSKGGNTAKKFISQSFTLMKQKSKGGKNKNRNQQNKDQQQETLF